MKVNFNFRLRQRIASLLVVLVPVYGYMETAVIDGIEWKYRVNDGKITIKGDGQYGSAIPSSVSGALNVPSEINEMPVVAIAENAFSSCDAITSRRDAENAEISELTIPTLNPSPSFHVRLDGELFSSRNFA